MTPSFRRPRLVNNWGVENFGPASTATGDVWWYEIVRRDGGVKRIPLRPMTVLTSDNSP